MYFKPKTVLCAHFIKIDDPCEHIIQFSSSGGGPAVQNALLLP